MVRFASADDLCHRCDTGRAVCEPYWRRVLAAFPFTRTILAVFTQHVIGAAASRKKLGGGVTGLLAFDVIVYVLGIVLKNYGLLGACICAVLDALAVQAVSWYRLPARRPLHINTCQSLIFSEIWKHNFSLQKGGR